MTVNIDLGKLKVPFVPYTGGDDKIDDILKPPRSKFWVSQIWDCRRSVKPSPEKPITEIKVPSRIEFLQRDRFRQFGTLDWASRDLENAFMSASGYPSRKMLDLDFARTLGTYTLPIPHKKLVEIPHNNDDVWFDSFVIPRYFLLKPKGLRPNDLIVASIPLKIENWVSVRGHCSADRYRKAELKGDKRYGEMMDSSEKRPKGEIATLLAHDWKRARTKVIRDKLLELKKRQKALEEELEDLGD